MTEPRDVIAATFVGDLWLLASDRERRFHLAAAVLAALKAAGYETYRPEECEMVDCPRCEGTGEHLSHPDQDCDVCANPRDWGEHVVECERCAGYGRTLAVLLPYPASDDTEGE